MILNLVFLKYTTAKEMDSLLAPFMGEHATHSSYDPANLLFIEDNARSMKRTMELVAMFDSEIFVDKRVRSYEISNGRPSELVKELDQVMKAYSVTDKSGVHFIAIDRINTLLAVAPNPGVFDEVKKWIDKLDVKAKITTGTTSLWVYQLKYQRAEIVALAIEALYTGNTAALIQMAQMMNASSYAQGIGNNGTGGGGGGGGMGMSSYGTGFGMGSYGYGASGYGGGYGTSGYGMNGNTYGNGYAGGSQGTAANGGFQTPVGIPGSGENATGMYLGAQPGAGASSQRRPHVVPNPFNNTLMIQGTAEEYEQIVNLLRQLDVAPRQVLLDIKIYEVQLSGAFSAGVTSYLQDKGTTAATGTSTSTSGLTVQQGLTAVAGASGLELTKGVVWGSKQLLGLLSASETKGLTRLINSPSIIATDGMAATMNVGDEVPVLTSTSSTSATVSGSSVFANTVSYQTTGTTVSITPHISASGVVTMAISQQVSAPVATSSGTGSSGISSDSFSNRSMSTQLTIMDGDTVAMGGAITETHTESSTGVPLLHRIPIIGAAFGSKSISTARSELIIFITPRVIYDSTQLLDATEELKTNLKRVGKLMKNDQ
jgi:general secretion pathway protein D